VVIYASERVLGEYEEVPMTSSSLSTGHWRFIEKPQSDKKIASKEVWILSRSFPVIPHNEIRKEYQWLATTGKD
jgi:hypothetical protein